MKIRDVIAALEELDPDTEVEVIDIDGEAATEITPGCQINID